MLNPDVTVPLTGEPRLDTDPERPHVFLLDAGSRLEQRLLTGWIDRHAGERAGETAVIAPSRRRRRGMKTDPRIAARATRGDDPLFIPLRVVWLPTERDGRRSANWIDVIKLGDPRDPHPLRQYPILDWFPGRVTIARGEAASASDLLDAHAATAEIMSLVDFITRRAHLALERAERAIRGNRYKVPQFLHEEILGRAEFRDGVMRVAGTAGLSPELAFARSRYYLREIAASHSPFLIDLIANAIHWIYRQGYGAIYYDPAAIEEITKLGQEHPIAFVPSHRSNLDRLSLQYLLWENDLPPNHTAAGINMNFFPVGPLIRRTGGFFIRRSFKENELYKYVLRSYLDYLVEKRFPLEWYMEGGRSRTGRLLPPRLGMLGWVVDAVRRGRADDLYLIPTSIVYDQIQDVASYASEAAGGAKQKESASWAFKAVRSLRRRYGNIHVRFARPISVAEEVDLTSEAELDLQKLSFEIMYRIASITAITPTAVVSAALLSMRGEEASPRTIAAVASSIDAHIEELDLPTTEPLRLEDPAEVDRVVQQLAAHGSVTVTDHTDGPRYRLEGDQALQAAYYRNLIVHFFVPGAIGEVAALVASTSDGDRLSAFWEAVAEIRDTLKFEFFFAGKDQFAAEVHDRMNRIAPDWESRLAPGDVEELLGNSPLLRAHWVLLPLFESYRIVADELCRVPGPVDEKSFVDAAMALGRRYLEDGHVGAEESVSKVVVASAFRLATNRDLTGGEPSVTERRRAFAAETRRFADAARRVGDIEGARRATET